MQEFSTKIEQIGLSNTACPFCDIIRFLDTQKNYAYQFIDWGYGELKVWDIIKDKLILHLDAYNNKLAFIYIN